MQRQLPFVVSLAILSFVIACGASAAEIKEARDSTYTCPKTEILDRASKILTDRVAPIAGSDLEAGLIATKYRWHEPSGRRKRVEVDVANPGDVFVSVIVLVKESALGGRRVSLASEVHGQVEGSPQAVPLPTGNAARPRWVDARDNELRVEIHKALWHCAVRVQGT